MTSFISLRDIIQITSYLNTFRIMWMIISSLSTNTLRLVSMSIKEGSNSHLQNLRENMKKKERKRKMQKGKRTKGEEDKAKGEEEEGEALRPRETTK